MKKGFTLLEIIIVVIIIGILATLGLTQFGRVVEKSRGAEAKQILGTLRSQAAAHYLEYNNLATPVTFDATRAGIGAGGDQIPGTCRASHYFSYGVNATANTLTATATRCGGGGRGGNSSATGRTLILTTTLPEGTDTWTGDGGY